MLNHIPRISINPDAFVDFPLLSKMSIFNKALPSKITLDVIFLYTRFGRFEELIKLAQSFKASKEIQLKIAEICRKLGQFESARQIYEANSSFDELFQLFVIFFNTHNLSVLCTKTQYSGWGKFMNLDPIQEPYEDLINSSVPPIRSLIPLLPSNLELGDEVESTPLFFS